MTGLHGYAEHFSAPEGYLDFARYGPPSPRVTEAAAAALAGPEGTGVPGRAAAPAGPAPGRPGSGLPADAPEAVQRRALSAAARLAGTDPDHAVLLPDTSSGLFHAALGVPSGTVLVPAGEFPANTYPWRRAAALGRAVPLRLDGPPSPEAVRAALTDDMAAVSVSAVGFRTGYRADLTALREVIGDRLLIVDAAQAFGVAEMDWRAADVVAACGRKWLRAGWGTGFAVVSDRALERLEPVLTGYAGTGDTLGDDQGGRPPAPGAVRFSMADPSPVAAAALATALELAGRTGIRRIERHVGERVEQLIDTVRSGGGRVLSPAARQERAGIVAFCVPGIAPAAVGAALEEAGVTATVHPGSVRLSPHASTPLSAVDRVLEALRGVGRSTASRAG